VRFASFLSGGFLTAIVVNPPERKLAMWWHFQLTFKLPSADISLKRLYKILYLKTSLRLTRLLTLLMLLTLSRARNVQKRVWRVISTLLRCACRLLLRHLDEWKWLRSLRLFGLHSFCHHCYLLRKKYKKLEPSNNKKDKDQDGELLISKVEIILEQR
jgi:hypothetical protein